MIESQNIRQILAIMVTDIVDYTETMNNDEAKAWEYLKKQRTLIPPMISKMNGHMFKEMGDGTFSKFKSAIDAVQCAIKIQEEAINNELPIRIAVHLGDVMDDGVDVIGTGVNIASRINSLAKTGNIVISEDVWRQVRNQADIEATSMGQKEIKGFHQTVEVFELTYNPDGSIIKKVKVTETVTITDDEGKEVQAQTAKKEFIKKVAVFPFDMVDCDESYDYLKHGFPMGCCISMLQDPLIEVEFPIGHLFDSHEFIGKLRKMGYEKGAHVPRPLKKKISNDIHCDYFIAGTIKLVDRNYTITGKLYLTCNGKLLSEITKTNSSYFTLIDELSIKFRQEMGIPLSHIDEIENLPFNEMTTETQELYADYINALLAQFNNNYDEAFDLLEKITQTDQTFSLANFLMSSTGFLSNNEERKSKVDNAMNLAISHLYKLPARFSFTIKTWYYFFIKGDPGKASKVCEMWIKQHPESINPYQMKINIFLHQDMYREALDVAKDLLDKHNNHYSTYRILCRCYIGLSDYKNAILFAEKYMVKCPSEASSYTLIADVYKKKGDSKQAKDYYEQALMLESDNITLITDLANIDMDLGNFFETEEQLNYAITLCKSNQDYSQVYNNLSEYYARRGQIRKSIEAVEKSNDYASKYTNPIDGILSKLVPLRDYALINQTDIALTRQKENSAELAHPFNLLAGFGEILIADIIGDKDLLKTGISKIDEFLRIKDFGHIKFIKKIAYARLNMLEENFSDAVNGYKESLIINDWLRIDSTRSIIICHTKNNDTDEAINVATKFLLKEPFSPTILLESAKTYIDKGNINKAKELLTKVLNIWENADEEYIYFQEAKKLWKEINTEKELA